MIDVNRLDVYMHGAKVGTLGQTREGRIGFAYDGEWVRNGFAISPLSLPLDERVRIADYQPFEGLYGVFADSLPDGWGRLLADRFMNARMGLNPETVSSLMRLQLVSDAGMGALEYRPRLSMNSEIRAENFDEIAAACRKMLEREFEGDLDRLFAMAGSSGGARPKIMTKIDGQEWIIKFPSSIDSREIGQQEFEYSQCARECGIQMNETRLFESEICEGYFGTRRFDRCEAGGKVHMVSASGLLETSHRVPSLDYSQLMRLTSVLTRDIQEMQRLYRLMCFNVFAHNRDDHSKNFSYLYETGEAPSGGRWRLSPAYDLTYSNSSFGQHANSVNGNGVNPGHKDVVAVGVAAGLDKDWCQEISEKIQRIVRNMLERYLR